MKKGRMFPPPGRKNNATGQLLISNGRLGTARPMSKNFCRRSRIVIQRSVPQHRNGGADSRAESTTTVRTRVCHPPYTINEQCHILCMLRTPVTVDCTSCCFHLQCSISSCFQRSGSNTNPKKNIPQIILSSRRNQCWQNLETCRPLLCGVAQVRPFLSGFKSS